MGIEDPVMEGNAPADADGRTLAPRLELRREVDKPVVVTRDPRGTARGTAMDRTAGDIPEKCPTKVAISSRAEEISKLKISPGHFATDHNP